jgi:hypothetical protein
MNIFSKMAERRKRKRANRLLAQLIVEYFEAGGTWEEITTPAVTSPVLWDRVEQTWFIRSEWGSWDADEELAVGSKVSFLETGRGGCTEFGWIDRKIAPGMWAITFDEPMGLSGDSE